MAVRLSFRYPDLKYVFLILLDTNSLLENITHEKIHHEKLSFNTTEKFKFRSDNYEKENIYFEVHEVFN